MQTINVLLKRTQDEVIAVNLLHIVPYCLTSPIVSPILDRCTSFSDDLTTNPNRGNEFVTALKHLNYCYVVHDSYCTSKNSAPLIIWDMVSEVGDIVNFQQWLLCMYVYHKWKWITCTHCMLKCSPLD